LLGASWNDLGQAVQRLHNLGDTVQATGTFQVRHGSNRLARWLARLAGLPPAGEAVEVRLVVTPQGRGEQWRRTFAGRPLVSFQRPRPDGLLAEHLGPLELRFRLEVAAGALIYHLVGVALRFGSLRIPLPRCCAPCVAAWEKPTETPDRVQVSVEVSLPLLGPLLAYEGTVTRVEAEQ
jgi:hypothetical protein